MKQIILLTLLITLLNGAFIASSSESAANLNSDTKQEVQKSKYWITAESVLGMVNAKQETLIIDVRSGTDFTKANIPGSMNIPLFAVKTKAFLKDKNILLINQGYNRQELENECLSLNKKGFNVRVIRGGLNSWKDAGGNIEGDAEAIATLNKISPHDIYLQDNPDSRLIINLTTSYDKKTDPKIPGSVFIPFDNENSFYMKLMENLDKKKDSSFLTVLIFNEKGEGYENIEKVVRKTGAKNVFYLTGGMEAYKDFLNKQSLMGKPEKKSSGKGNGCGTCQ
jgi:rhodanese-related sulfurtransferase